MPPNSFLIFIRVNPSIVALSLLVLLLLPVLLLEMSDDSTRNSSECGSTPTTVSSHFAADTTEYTASDRTSESAAILLLGGTLLVLTLLVIPGWRTGVAALRIVRLLLRRRWSLSVLWLWRRRTVLWLVLAVLRCSVALLGRRLVLTRIRSSVRTGWVRRLALLRRISLLWRAVGRLALIVELVCRHYQDRREGVDEEDGD